MKHLISVEDIDYLLHNSDFNVNVEKWKLDEIRRAKEIFSKAHCNILLSCKLCRSDMCRSCHIWGKFPSSLMLNDKCSLNGFWRWPLSRWEWLPIARHDINKHKHRREDYIGRFLLFLVLFCPASISHFFESKSNTEHKSKMKTLIMPWDIIQFQQNMAMI